MCSWSNFRAAVVCRVQQRIIKQAQLNYVLLRVFVIYYSYVTIIHFGHGVLGLGKTKVYSFRDRLELG